MDDIEARHKLRTNALVRAELYKQLAILEAQDAQLREVAYVKEN